MNPAPSTIQPRIRETVASFSTLALEQGGSCLQEDGGLIVVGYNRVTRFEFEQNREATA